MEMNGEESGDNWSEFEEMRYNETERDEEGNEIYRCFYVTYSY